MQWDRYLRRDDLSEDALARIRLRLLSERSAGVEPVELCRDDDLRLFPIVGFDLCYPVASLLSRGRLEEASQLVSDRCWVASTPLYG